MKRFFLIMAILGVTASLHAQQKRVLSAASTDCSVANSCLVYNIDPNNGGATFTVSANAGGNTLQFEVTGDGGVTWVPITSTQNSVSSSTQASSTTVTGTWQFNVAG